METLTRLIILLTFICYCSGSPRLMPCQENPCLNGATCIQLFGFQLCVCPEEYMGRTCADVVPACNENPCQNGGTCIDIPTREFECNCPEFFYGDLCEQAPMVRFDGVSIASPNYTDGLPYPNNFSEVWIVTAEAGLILDVSFTSPFELETDFDVLELGQGSYPTESTSLATFTGRDVPEAFLAETNQVWITFQTDDNKNKAGFSMTLTAVDVTDAVICGDGKILPPSTKCNTLWQCDDGADEEDCGELPGGAFLTATSPRFPSKYAENLEETWTFTAADGQVFLIDFNVHEMEYGFDFLRIGGGGFCETEYYREFTGFDLPRPFLITNESLCCHFSTDRSINFRGWSMGVYVLDPDDVATCPETDVILSPADICNALWDCQCGYDEQGCDPLSENSTVAIQTPNYPFNYPANLTSTWTINATYGLQILIEFEDFYTEEDEDVLRVGFGLDPTDDTSVVYEFSGNDATSIVIDDNQAWVQFTSNEAEQGRGFLANISVIYDDDLVATTVETYVT
ncbi:tolloid-like protein 2 [Apostichopus japonicus]|uniref:tolloid-like protein 2 n=1 Tax=Stichopus japonicus TaxID=307972 RepID=UPI003AB25745